jgi:hypothetical protein
MVDATTRFHASFNPSSVSGDWKSRKNSFSCSADKIMQALEMYRMQFK